MNDAKHHSPISDGMHHIAVKGDVVRDGHPVWSLIGQGKGAYFRACPTGKFSLKNKKLHLRQW